MTEASTRDAVLQAIDLVHRSCEAVQVATPDLVVESMAGALATIRTGVEAHWPLTPAYKDRIVIGPVAAKNLDDWQPDLAGMLMTLDYILRHDGTGVDAFLAAQAGSAIGGRRAVMQSVIAVPGKNSS